MHYGERAWTEIEGVRERVVVLPLGALEQHGHHLPLLTDSMIGGDIARRAEQELGDTALFLPTLWIGASDHHRAYAGTLSLSNDLYARVITEILESLIASGFRRIFLLTAHGGNLLPGSLAIYDTQLRHRDKPDLWLALASWWQIAEQEISALDPHADLQVTHACELETSMILHLRPELVNLDAAHGATVPFASAFYVPDWSAPSRVNVARSFEQISTTGAIGHPERATAALGEALFAAAVAQIVAFVREFATWPVVEPR
jgi:creatinine amidohydrolase